MPTICCAIGCKHTTGNGICHLKRFPTNENRAIVWAENVRGSKWNRKGWELLCDCHFDISQFEKPREDGARKLKHNAVPTLFPTHTVPLGDGLSNPLESAFAFDAQFEPMGLELLHDEGVAKLPDTVPFLFPSETLMLDEVHFEESAFELHRADGRRKLKPNAVPSIHSISKNAPSRKKQAIAPKIEFPFVDDGDDSLGLSALGPSKTNESELSQTIGDYEYQLEGIFGHGPLKKQVQVSASDFVSSLLTRKNDSEPGSNSTCSAEVEKGIGSVGGNSNGQLVHFEDAVFDACTLEGGRKRESIANSLTLTVAPVVRSKRKQSVKPRIELPLIDSADECAVTPKVRLLERRKQPLQGNAVSDGGGDKHHRKRLGTISVTEYVHNTPARDDAKPRTLRISGADLETEAAENSRETSIRNLGKNLNQGNFKHKRPVRTRKRGKLKRNSLDADSGCANFGDSGISTQEVDFSVISASEVDDVNYNCFVCSKVIASRFAILLSVPSEASNIPLSQHVKDIAGLEGQIDSLEVVCRRCSSLLNHIDKTEAELNVLKRAVSTCTKGAKGDPDIVRSMQILDKFSTVLDGKHGVLSLEELLSLKSGSKVVDRENAFNSPDKEVTDSVSSQGETKELVAEIYVEELELDGQSTGTRQILRRDLISTEEHAVSNESDLVVKCESFEVDEEGEKEDPIFEQGDGDERIREDESVTKSSVSDGNADQQIKCDPSTHLCKICSFKTVFESVMIWHLRMHMKNHRWCDFCTTTIPDEESAFIRAKKSRPLYQPPHKRRTIPKPSFILPTARVNPVNLSSVPVSKVPSFPISVLPLQGLESENPVVVISGEQKSVEEVTDSNRDHKNSDDIPADDNASSKVLIYSKNVVVSENSFATKDSSVSGSLVAIPPCKDDETNSSFAPRVELSIGAESEHLETLCGMYVSETENLVKNDNLASIKAGYNACLDNSSNPDDNTVLHNYSNLPAASIVESECQHTDNDFIDGSSQRLKPSSIHSEEVYGEGTESSFLDSLATQPATKYTEILPVIVGEAAMQSTLSDSNHVAEGGVTSKDVSFARRGSLGVSDIAMAYENSVAALMCQSDDSDGILPYN